MIRRGLALSNASRRDKGGRDGGYVDIHFQEVEQGGPVHCDLTHYEPLSGGRKETKKRSWEKEGLSLTDAREYVEAGGIGDADG